VYQAALVAAGVSPSTIGFVEAHGTGTAVGDPIEYASLAAVYGVDGPCALGSVKTNFGHCQSTSGPLGLMKAILALQHGVVPQNLHFTRLPDQLAKIETELFVPQATTPWPENGQHPRPARSRSTDRTDGSNMGVTLPSGVAPRDLWRGLRPPTWPRPLVRSGCRPDARYDAVRQLKAVGNQRDSVTSGDARISLIAWRCFCNNGNDADMGGCSHGIGRGRGRGRCAAG
jgi:hypothetical protein